MVNSGSRFFFVKFDLESYLGSTGHPLYERRRIRHAANAVKESPCFSNSVGSILNDRSKHVDH